MLAPVLQACSLRFFRELLVVFYKPFFPRTGKVNYSQQNTVILSKLGIGSEITEAAITWLYVCLVVVTGLSL